MRVAPLAGAVALSCSLVLVTPGAAHGQPSSFADRVLAGSLLGASTAPTFACELGRAQAVPTEDPNTTGPQDRTPDTPGIDLLAVLDPRAWAADILDAVISAIGRSLLEALRSFSDWALGLGDSSLNFVTSTPAAGSYDSASVRTLWEFTRALANAALAVIVMWGGFNVVVKDQLRSPYHGVMELLPRVILGALAANLTLELSRLLIDLNNALGASVGQVGLPGYDQAGAAQSGIALVFVALAYGVVVLLMVFQMLMRLALIDLLIVLAPVMMVLWVLPQTQSWARWWAQLFPLTVFQQAVQLLVLRLGTALMVELTPGSVSNAVLTLLLGIAVCWLTLKVPALLRGQVQHAGIGGAVSLVVLSRYAGGLAARGRSAAGR